MSGQQNLPGDKKQDKNIPIRRVPLADQSQLPPDYCATPGGTLFSTTPGGTRIIYEREFLMQCRSSPLTKSPPANMANIPGITRPLNGIVQSGKSEIGGGSGDQNKKENTAAEDAQFQMEI